MTTFLLWAAGYVTGALSILLLFKLLRLAPLQDKESALQATRAEVARSIERLEAQ